MSQVEMAMTSLIAAFHTYSGKEGDKLTLSKAELNDLLKAELGGPMGGADNKAALDKIFKDLDQNKDQSVDFQEYITLVAAITMMGNEFFSKSDKKQAPPGELSNVLSAMEKLITVFHKYSGKEGDKLTLSKSELSDLLKAELGGIMGPASDKAAMDKIFKDLDANGDQCVDFQEYVTLVACLTMICNEFFTKA